MATASLVQLALPAAVVEDLLRRHQLHLEQERSLDASSHRELQRLVARIALHGRPPID
jgi:hypothetical protein